VDSITKLVAEFALPNPEFLFRQSKTPSKRQMKNINNSFGQNALSQTATLFDQLIVTLPRRVGSGHTFGNDLQKWEAIANEI
jgi:hypothetical protein